MKEEGSSWSLLVGLQVRPGEPHQPDSLLLLGLGALERSHFSSGKTVASASIGEFAFLPGLAHRSGIPSDAFEGSSVIPRRFCLGVDCRPRARGGSYLGSISLVEDLPLPDLSICQWAVAERAWPLQLGLVGLFSLDCNKTISK